MKRALIVASALLLLLPAFAAAQEPSPPDAPVAASVLEAAVAITEVVVLEDGTVEEHIRIPATETGTDVQARVANKEIVAIENEARQKIAAVRENINRLADRSDEGELQKEIERIKLDAEIARFEVLRQAAEEKENFELADELQQEISHLQTIDQPVYGTRNEQLEQYGVPAPGGSGAKEGK